MIAETEEAKIYLGHIKQINSDAVVKRYVLPTLDNNAEKLFKSNMDILRIMKHNSLCKYFDVVLMKQNKV